MAPIIKNILIIGNSPEAYELYEILKDKFSVLRYDSTAEFDKSDIKEVNAVVIDSGQAVADDHDFLKRSAQSGIFAFIPVIVITKKPQTDAELECLSYGVLDFITAPFQEVTVLNRIKNAIHIKDSASFYEIERMLKALPSNIYLKDAEGKYIFATQYWHHLEHSGDPDWTIRGKTDVDIRKDKENAIMAMKKDMEVIRTGKGDAYVIKIVADGITEYFQVYKEPVRDEFGNINGIIAQLNNITETEILKDQLKKAAILDGLTGLFNRKEIQARIDEAVSAYKNGGKKFSLVMLDIDNFKLVNDSYGHQQGDVVIITLADILKNNRPMLKEAYAAGRWGGEEFMLILHDTELAAASDAAELIRRCFADTSFPDMNSQTISLGVAEITENDTSDSICTRVDKNLYLAKKQGKNRVCAV